MTIPGYIVQTMSAPLQSMARILFFGQCKVGHVFKDMIGITNETNGGRAMIVPKITNSSGNLIAAALAWKNIVQKLRSGMNVFDAVEFANRRLRNNDDPDTPFSAPGNPFQGIEFEVIGDQSASIN